MSERYLKILEKLKKNELIIHDGAIGTELQKRGIVMDGSWCGTASYKIISLNKYTRIIFVLDLRLLQLIHTHPVE